MLNIQRSGQLSETSRKRSVGSVMGSELLAAEAASHSQQHLTEGLPAKIARPEEVLCQFNTSFILKDTSLSFQSLTQDCLQCYLPKRTINIQLCRLHPKKTVANLSQESSDSKHLTRWCTLTPAKCWRVLDKAYVKMEGHTERQSIPLLRWVGLYLTNSGDGQALCGQPTPSPRCINPIHLAW